MAVFVRVCMFACMHVRESLFLCVYACARMLTDTNALSMLKTKETLFCVLRVIICSAQCNINWDDSFVLHCTNVFDWILFIVLITKCLIFNIVNVVYKAEWDKRGGGNSNEMRS